MKRIVIIQQVIERSDGPLTPTVTNLFEAIKTAAGQYTAIWNGGDKYQVKGPRMNQCVVDMSKKVCTCRKWELNGIPCKHAVATIWNMSENGMNVGLPEEYVHPTYFLQTWKAVYANKINPINGREYWPKSPVPTTLLPPLHHTQVGRPKKKRKRSAGEISSQIVVGGKVTRVGKSMKCGLCKNNGHNKRSCKGQGGGSASQACGNGSASQVAGGSTSQVAGGGGVKMTKKKAKRISPKK